MTDRATRATFTSPHLSRLISDLASMTRPVVAPLCATLISATARQSGHQASAGRAARRQLLVIPTDFYD
jgi:hypothetical protein